MKSKKPDAELVWKQIEDLVVPRLSLSPVDRVVYWHLVRHSRLEGKARLSFSIKWLAQGVRLAGDTVRQAVRRLVEQGALRLLERSKAGHVVYVRLPEEIPAVRAKRIEEVRATHLTDATSLEEMDFMQTRALRAAFTSASGEIVSTACDESLCACDAWIISWRGFAEGATLTATWCPAASNATRRRENEPRKIFFAGCTANGS